MNPRIALRSAAPIALALASLLVTAGSAIAGAPAVPFTCQQPLTNVLQNGNNVSIEECTYQTLPDTLSGAQALFAQPDTFYNVYNQSAMALSAFAVSTSATIPSVTTTRQDWQAQYVSKAQWDQALGMSSVFGPFADLFGGTDSGVAFYNTDLVNGNPLAPFFNSHEEFFIDADPNSNFVAFAANGTGGLVIAAQSLTPVPEVPALWLMGAGLAGLAAFKRHRRKR